MLNYYRSCDLIFFPSVPRFFPSASHCTLKTSKITLKWLTMCLKNLSDVALPSCNDNNYLSSNNRSKVFYEIKINSSELKKFSLLPCSIEEIKKSIYHVNIRILRAVVSLKKFEMYDLRKTCLIKVIKF